MQKWWNGSLWLTCGFGPKHHLVFKQFHHIMSWPHVLSTRKHTSQLGAWWSSWSTWWVCHDKSWKTIIISPPRPVIVHGDAVSSCGHNGIQHSGVELNYEMKGGLFKNFVTFFHLVLLPNALVEINTRGCAHKWSIEVVEVVGQMVMFTESCGQK